jgi:predicted metal-dependent phosphoesterase TrpH
MIKNLKTVYPCDLHCHTVRSDGNDTPLELINNAAELGMTAIAITDHDITPPLTVTLPDGSEQDIVVYAASRGVTLIPGYEFSCDTRVDDVHICGYRLDWTNPLVAAEVESGKRSKTRAYEELCEKLTERGMPLDWERDILNYTNLDGTRKSRRPEEVQRKHIFEALAQKRYVSNWSDGKILVRDNPELNVQRHKIDPVDAINLIHQCGGIAILAHPYLIDEKVSPDGQTVISRDNYIERLIAAGLDGIEVSYSYDKTTYKGVLTPEEIEVEVRKKYAGRMLLFSGGSDYHSDNKKGAKKVRQLGERGLTDVEFNQIFNQ